MGLWLSASPAQAHPDLDRGVELAMEAEFESALEAFDAALGSGELNREELVTLLTERILVEHALGREAALNADLTYLASIEPSHELGPRAPPPLQTQWKTTVGSTPPLRMQVDAQGVPGGAQLKVQLEGAATDTAPAVRIWTRTSHSQWQSVDGPATEVPSPTGGEVFYYVEAVGLGQVALLEAGNADAPRHVEAFALSPTTDAESPSAEPWVRRYKWWLVGGAVAVVAIAAIAGGIAAGGGGNGNNTPVTPMVVF